MIIDSYIPFKSAAFCRLELDMSGLEQSFSSAFVGTFFCFPFTPFMLAGDLPFHTLSPMSSINSAAQSVQNKIGKYMIALLAMVK